MVTEVPFGKVDGSFMVNDITGVLGEVVVSLVNDSLRHHDPFPHAHTS